MLDYGPHRIAGGPKLVLHCTDAAQSFVNARDYILTKPRATYHSLHHLLEGRSCQFSPFDRMVGGMKNDDRRTVDTNGSMAYQACIVGRAAAMRDLNPAELDHLAGIVAWYVTELGVSTRYTTLWDWASPGTTVAYAGAPQRKAFNPPRTWEPWSGVTQHAFAWGNDHWDCGWLDLRAVMARVETLILPAAPPIVIPPTIEGDEGVRVEIGFLPDGRGNAVSSQLGLRKIASRCVPRSARNGPHLVVPQFVNTWSTDNPATGQLVVVLPGFDGAVNCDLWIEEYR